MQKREPVQVVTEVQEEPKALPAEEFKTIEVVASVDAKDEPFKDVKVVEEDIRSQIAKVEEPNESKPVNLAEDVKL